MSLFRVLIRGLAAATLGISFAFAAANAQAPGLVQPWGLPPLPAGVGPVEKFADVSGTPQGQFLEGGAFDTQGNLWFVAIGSGWVSYLTPDGKLVPVFNCNPPPELGQTCEPQGTRWFEGKLYLTSRHRGILVYDPQTKEVKHSRLYLPQPTVQRSQRPRFRRRGEPVLHRSLGHRPGPEPDRPNGRRLPVFARRHAAQGDGQRVCSRTELLCHRTTRCSPSAISEAAGSGTAHSKTVRLWAARNARKIRRIRPSVR